MQKNLHLLTKSIVRPCHWKSRCALHDSVEWNCFFICSLRVISGEITGFWAMVGTPDLCPWPGEKQTWWPVHWLPTSSFAVDLFREVLFKEARIIIFFLFLWGFFRHLLMLLCMSLWLCQQTSRQLDLPLACTAPKGEERIWPWGLLLCGPLSQTGSAAVLYLID